MANLDKVMAKSRLFYCFSPSFADLFKLAGLWSNASALAGCPLL
jgi:hypothetical protein